MLRPHHLLLPLIALLGFNSVVEAAAPDFTAKLWTSPIPYMIDPQLRDVDQQGIRNSIETFKQHTCLEFEENGNGPLLEFALVPNGFCKSAVGDHRSINANHVIDLDTYCYDGTSFDYTIPHELMHALGFQHTELRPDRDDYVNIYTEKMNDAEKAKYKKLEVTEKTTDYKIPYDFGSIMHSSSGDFMKAKDPDFDTLGDMIILGMSFNDWKIVNLHYKCDEACASRIECHNGGYQHPRQCDKCVCPPFYNGMHCDEEPETIILKPGDPPYEIDDGFKLNSTIKDNGIKSPEGTRIRIKIINIFDIIMKYVKHCKQTCNYKAIMFVDGDLTRRGNKRYCCYDKNGHEFVSNTNVVGFQMYALPGLDFGAKVTFTVEGTPPSDGNEQANAENQPAVESEDHAMVGVAFDAN